MQQFQDLLIDTLLDFGFTLPEAERIIELQELFSHVVEVKRNRDDMAFFMSQNQMPRDGHNHIMPQSLF